MLAQTKIPRLANSARTSSDLTPVSHRYDQPLDVFEFFMPLPIQWMGPEALFMACLSICPYTPRAEAFLTSLLWSFNVSSLVHVVVMKVFNEKSQG